MNEAESTTGPIERFLAAIRSDDASAAQRVVSEHPEIVGSSFPAACCVGDVDTVAAWLARDPTQARSGNGREGWPPLIDLCLSRFHASGRAASDGILRCATLLLDHGADPNTFVTIEGETWKLSALYYACMSNNVPVVRLLLENGANPNDGESVYHAAEHDHRECLELLAAHGADLGGRSPEWGNTPLYFLAGYKEPHPMIARATSGMRWLLEHGADPNVTSTDRHETPLHRVADFGRGAEVVNLLLDHGADPLALRADGRTAYTLAARAGNIPAADVLAARGGSTALAPIDALIGACMRGDESAARGMLAADPGLMASMTHDDWASLARVAENGEAASVRLLVDLGFDLGWEGEWGGTALHHAAWVGDVAMVRLLLELGAPVNVRDRTYGCSPIAWAAHGSANGHGREEDYCTAVEELLAAGSEPAPATNRWGKSAAEMASPRVRELLEARGFGVGSMT